MYFLKSDSAISKEEIEKLPITSPFAFLLDDKTLFHINKINGQTSQVDMFAEERESLYGELRYEWKNVDKPWNFKVEDVDQLDSDIIFKHTGCYCSTLTVARFSTSKNPGLSTPFSVIIDQFPEGMEVNNWKKTLIAGFENEERLKKSRELAASQSQFEQRSKELKELIFSNLFWPEISPVVIINEAILQTDDSVLLPLFNLDTTKNTTKESIQQIQSNIEHDIKIALQLNNVKNDVINTVQVISEEKKNIISFTIKIKGLDAKWFEDLLANINKQKEKDETIFAPRKINIKYQETKKPNPDVETAMPTSQPKEADNLKEALIAGPVNSSDKTPTAQNQKDILTKLRIILNSKVYWKPKTHSLFTDFPNTILKLAQILAKKEEENLDVINQLASLARTSKSYKEKHPILYAITSGRRDPITEGFYQTLINLADPATATKSAAIEKINKISHEINSSQELNNTIK